MCQLLNIYYYFIIKIYYEKLWIFYVIEILLHMFINSSISKGKFICLSSFELKLLLKLFISTVRQLVILQIIFVCFNDFPEILKILFSV